MLAVGVVFLVEYLDDTVKTADEVRRTLGLPVIGIIARMNGDKNGGIRVAKEPRSPVAEAFRTLRTNIQFASVDRPLRTLLITSPGPQEGKTTISTNLAAVITQGGKRVIRWNRSIDDGARPFCRTVSGW
jgi:Mrp family chromosome partitioning ATPase